MPIRRLIYSLLPQRLLSRIAGAAARGRAGPLTRFAIRRFVRRFGVDLAEAAEPDLRAYPDFAAFFARALRPGARGWPAEQEVIASPVDGEVSASGRIEAGTLLQAKGLRYSAAELIGDATLAGTYDGGAFATLYLRPHDYHRVHCPLDGRLVAARHCRGHLWPVRPWAVSGVPRLFVRNERLALDFETDAGRYTLVMVGALFVGGIETVVTGCIRHDRLEPVAWNFSAAPQHFARGDEIGRFNFGSTVVLLFPPGMVEMGSGAMPGSEIRLGAPLARMENFSRAS